MNPLNDLPAVRKALYILQWVVNGILAVTGAVVVVKGWGIEQLPEWYVLALGIGPVLWTYLGITAQQHVPDSPIDE